MKGQVTRTPRCTSCGMETWLVERLADQIPVPLRPDCRCGATDVKAMRRRSGRHAMRGTKGLTSWWWRGRTQDRLFRWRRPCGAPRRSLRLARTCSSLTPLSQVRFALALRHPIRPSLRLAYLAPAHLVAVALASTAGMMHLHGATPTKTRAPPDRALADEEMLAFCRLGGAASSVPKMANMLEGGGKTPIRTAGQLEDMGFGLVAYPLTVFGAAVRAMETALEELR